MTRMMLGASVPARLLRGLMLRVMPRLPPARRRFEAALAGLDYPGFAG